MLPTIFLSALAASVEARNLSFNHESVVLNGSLYQSAYLDGNVFATSSVGRVVNESYLFKVDAKSLKVVDTVRPDRENKSGLLWAVYGTGANSKKNHIWVTNTRLNTVSVYDSNLSLVSHLPVNTTKSPRDVVVNNEDEKAYVTGIGTGLGVYDANDLSYSGWIELQTESQQFKTTMEIVLDSANQVIYTVSLSSNVAAGIDLKNNNKVTYYQLGNATRASGVAFDTKRSHLYVVSQGSDQILVVDTKEGANATSKAISLPTTFSTKRAAHDDVSSEIQVQDGDLFAGYEPKNDLVYVVNRVHNEVYVIDPATNEVAATLKTGKNPNHVTFDPNGDAYVTDKDTPTRLHRFSLQGGAGNSSSPSAGASGSGNGAGAAAASGSASASGKGQGGSAPASNGAAQVLAGAGVALIPALSLLI